MRILLTLVLLSAALAATQTTPRGKPQDALALAVRSQALLDEYVIGAMEPDAMKYAQRLRLTRVALDGQRQQWPTVRSGADPWDSYSACKNALEKASEVAGLSATKAVSTRDNKVFQIEKTRLQQLRTECKRQISLGTSSAAVQK